MKIDPEAATIDNLKIGMTFKEFSANFDEEPELFLRTTDSSYITAHFVKNNLMAVFDSSDTVLVICVNYPESVVLDDFNLIGKSPDAILRNFSASKYKLDRFSEGLACQEYDFRLIIVENMIDTVELGNDAP